MKAKWLDEFSTTAGSREKKLGQEKPPQVHLQVHLRPEQVSVYVTCFNCHKLSMQHALMPGGRPPTPDPRPVPALLRGLGAFLRSTIAAPGAGMWKPHRQRRPSHAAWLTALLLDPLRPGSNGSARAIKCSMFFFWQPVTPLTPVVHPFQPGLLSS